MARHAADQWAAVYVHGSAGGAVWLGGDAANETMTIGVLQLELSIGDAMSLKDKRRVVKSLKDRIAHGHNVSIAEVGALDEHRRSIVGIAMVANDRAYVEGALSKLVDFVRSVGNVDLVDYQIELL